MLDLESRQVTVSGRDVGTAWVFTALVVGGLLLHSLLGERLLDVAKDVAPDRANKPHPTVLVEVRRASCIT
jgi:hypothetical protein